MRIEPTCLQKLLKKLYVWIERIQKVTINSLRVNGLLPGNNLIVRATRFVLIRNTHWKFIIPCCNNSYNNKKENQSISRGEPEDGVEG